MSEIVFGHTDTLKIALTTTENKKPARPHQAFLTLADADTNLEFSFPIGVKTSGKGKLDIVCGNIALRIADLAFVTSTKICCSSQSVTILLMFFFSTHF